MTIRPRPRRNDNFVVEIGNRGFFIKRANSEVDSAAIRVEAETIRWLSERPGRYRSSFPLLLAYDPNQDLLVTDFAQGTDLWEDAVIRRRVRLRSAARLGRLLATVHQTPRPGHLPQSGGPWIASEIIPTLDQFVTLSSGRLAVTEILQSYPALVYLAQDAAAEWEPVALTHGDVKLDNVVLCDDERIPAIRLIDFELAGCGDPRWDVGSGFATYLALWMYSIPDPAAVSSEVIAGRALVPIASVQRAVRAFWRSYSTMTGADDSFKMTAIRFAAIRLLQTAHEAAQLEARLPQASVLAIQVAYHVLRSPHEAARILLGLS